jgi:hypothetical protein
VDDYFSKKGGFKTLGLRGTFEWIIKPPVKQEGVAVVETPRENEISNNDQSGRQLNSLQTLASGPFLKIERTVRGPGESDEELTGDVKVLLRKRGEENNTQEQDDIAAEDQAVFRQAYIPQTLNEVFDPERDIEKRNKGNTDDLIYANVIGVEGRGEGEEGGKVVERKEEGGDSSSNSASDTDDDDDDDDDDGDHKKKTPRGHRHEDRDAKKVSLQKVVKWQRSAGKQKKLTVMIARNGKKRQKKRQGNVARLKCPRRRKKVK